MTSRLVSFLKRVTDADLEQLIQSQERAASQALVGLDWKSLDEFPPSFLTLLHFEASVITEQHQRQDAIRHAEMEMNDGHLVTIGYGSNADSYVAYCLPAGDDSCWVGLDQKTIEEAIEDGRRHHPNHEPEIWPYLESTL